MQCEGVAWIKMAKGKLLLCLFQQNNEPLSSERFTTFCCLGLEQCLKVEPLASALLPLYIKTQRYDR